MWEGKFEKPTGRDLWRRGQSLVGGRDLGDACEKRLWGHTKIRKPRRGHDDNIKRRGM